MNGFPCCLLPAALRFLAPVMKEKNRLFKNHVVVQGHHFNTVFNQCFYDRRHLVFQTGKIAGYG
jgi:hypothetical protein